jgi:hypothetical protein
VPTTPMVCHHSNRSPRACWWEHPRACFRGNEGHDHECGHLDWANPSDGASHEELVEADRHLGVFAEIDVKACTEQLFAITFVSFPRSCHTRYLRWSPLPHTSSTPRMGGQEGDSSGA